jgi:hypothetical protein
MKFAVKRLLLCAALAIAVPATAGADSIVNSLDNVVSGTDYYDNTIGAQSFTTGSQAQVLQSVTLDLVGGTGTDTVSLYNNGAGIPGTLALGLGTVTPNVAGDSLYTLNAPSTFTLAADTTYWVTVQYAYTATMTQTGPWTWTDGNPNYTITGSGTMGAYATYSGSTWTPSALGPDNGPYLLSVNSVPEPSTLVLATVAVLFGIGVTSHKHCKWNAEAAA